MISNALGGGFFCKATAVASSATSGMCLAVKPLWARAWVEVAPAVHGGSAEAARLGPASVLEAGAYHKARSLSEFRSGDAIDWPAHRFGGR